LSRAILLLAVAAVLATLVAATAAPAFAKAGGNPTNLKYFCTHGAGVENFVSSKDARILEEQGFTCTKVEKRRL
jgi:hypothetical protein